MCAFIEIENSSQNYSILSGALEKVSFLCIKQTTKFLFANLKKKLVLIISY